jgi:transposase-like protein
MGKRQRFTQEFKQEALRLWKSSGRPAAAVAPQGNCSLTPFRTLLEDCNRLGHGLANLRA